MKRNPLYSRPFLKIVQIVSFAAIVILLVSNILKIRSFARNKLDVDTVFFYVTIAVNFCVCVICCILLFLPTKIILISLVSFLYSGLIFVFEIENPMGIFMFFLGLSSLASRGFYSSKRKLKLTLACVFYFLLVFSEIRFGFELFFKYLIEKIGYSLVSFVISFFLYTYFRNISDSETQEKILNLYHYKGLNKRDAEWLGRVQKNEKYQSIAISYKMSTGTVKNRLNVVYNILGVGDKSGFINRYGDFDIVYFFPA